ncbi:MAG TPA: hypothetical protein VMG41_07410 [Gemmatimonadales bacterium]|nr:hypothetical protein [Gemmatimonadales bacterium]
MRRSALIATLLALSTPVAGSAQYVPTQDLSLKGLAAVDLLVSFDGSDLSSDSTAALRDGAEVELRKSGLVIASRQGATARPDGRLRIVLSASANGRWTDDMVVRVQVEQTAILARTQEPMLMVTWYSEETASRVATTDLIPVARSLMGRGLDRFLKAWLASNGR